jgi:hypothetical protein
MDEADQAADLQEREMREKLRVSASKAQKREKIPRGLCYTCEAAVADPKLFCDKGCADEYETMKKQGLL